MMRSLPLAGCLLLAAAGPVQARQSPPSSASPAAAAEPGAGARMKEDVATLDLPTNAGRFDALAAILRREGLPFEVQSFANVRPEYDPRPTGRNLVVSIGAGEPELVIGAHFDAIPLRGETGKISAGMVDNGAGAVVLTRVAGALAREPLRRRVTVVFFDMEEIGHGGSRHFVAALDRARVGAMINLDIAAYGDAVMSGPGVGGRNETVHRALASVCAREGLHCLRFPEYPASDDLSFQAADIPNVSVGILPRVEAHQLWLLLNAREGSGLREGFAPAIATTIHSARDSLDRVEPVALELALRTVLALARTLDAELPPPRTESNPASRR